MEVVKFPITNLGDIPTKLRELADKIESGSHQEVTTTFVILPCKDGYPIIYGFGNTEGDNHPIIQLEFAKAWFVNNLVGRN